MHIIRLNDVKSLVAISNEDLVKTYDTMVHIYYN